MGDGLVDVVNVEREMVPSDVAVTGYVGLAVCRVIGEHLQVAAVAQALEPDLLDRRSRVDAQLDVHPVVVGSFPGKRVHAGGTEHADEEFLGLAEIANGDAQVVDPSQPGNL